MLRIVRFLLVTFVLALSAFFGVSAAAAQTVAGGLQGEQFVASGFFTEGIPGFPSQGGQTQECDPDGTSTVRFRASGIATGPYPGTFTETGTVTIGAQTLNAPGVTGTAQAGPVLTFRAQFTIMSAAGTVTGTKELSATLNRQPFSSVGACASFENSTQLGIFRQQLFYASISGRTYVTSVASSYEATIVTPTGTIRDTGDAVTSFNEAYLTGGTCVPTAPVGCRPSGAGSLAFRESFFSIVREDPAPALVVLTPPTAVNNVGTSHTVTATVTTTAGTPAANTTVLFTVIGAVTTTGECTTNAQGQCQFTYTGPDFPGVDLITGCADSNDDGDADTGEPCGEATKIWLLPATVPGQVTGGGWITMDGGRVSFGFNAQADEAGGAAKGNCNVIDHATKKQIKCLTVDSLVVTPTHATFFGQARVDGSTTNYRIDVDDLGEPGLADTFKIQLDNGYTAGGTLEGGNIQIHR
jgi:hypothetical protein